MSINKKQKVIHTLGAVAVCSLLAACGGGSTPAPQTMQPTVTPPPPPPPPEPTSPVTTEYRNAIGLAEIRASGAYEKGYTGEGIVIASLENGVDDQHPDLAGQIHPDSMNFGDTPGLVEARLNRDGSEAQGLVHGSLTSGIMVAKKNNEGMHGVAYEAQLMMLKMTDYDADGNLTFAFDRFPEAVNYATDKNADVFLVEFSFWDDTKNDFTDAEHRIADEDEIPMAVQGPLKDAFRNLMDNDVVLVIPSSNNYASAPTDFITPIGLEAGYEGKLISVGAVDRDQNIYDRSNKAGYAMDYFVVAPSEVRSTLPVNGDYSENTNEYGVTSNGTSFAGPWVAGMAALLRQAYPNLTAAEVIEIILTTATDLGEPGVDEIYGHGLINIRAAFEPVGQITIATASGAVTPVEQTFLNISAAFGDAVGLGLSASPVLIQDRFQRPFEYNLGSNLYEQAGNSFQLNSLLRAHDIYNGFYGAAPGGIGMSVSYQDDYQTIAGLAESLPQAMQARLENRQRLSMAFDRAIGEDTTLFAATGLPASHVLNAYTSQEQRIASGTRSLGLSPDVNPYASLYQDADIQGFGAVRQISEDQSFYVAGSLYNARQTLQAQTFANGRLRDAKRIDTVAGYSWFGTHTNLTVAIGAIIEDGSVLGSLSAGALSLGDRASTAFTQTRFEAALGSNWSLAMTASGGITKAAVSASSILEMDAPLLTSSFAINATKHGIFANADAFTIGISQPLRAESGSAMMTLAAGFNFASESFNFKQAGFGLTPTGREIDFEIGYAISFGQSFSLQMNGMMRRHPGHIKSNGWAPAGLVRSSIRF